MNASGVAPAGRGTNPVGMTDLIRVVFLWNSIRAIGGVTTFLQGSLANLPRHGIDPIVVELGYPHRRHKQVGDMLDLEPGWKVVDGRPRPWHSPRGYRRFLAKRIAL